MGGEFQDPPPDPVRRVALELFEQLLEGVLDQAHIIGGTHDRLAALVYTRERIEQKEGRRP